MKYCVLNIYNFVKLYCNKFWRLRSWKNRRKLYYKIINIKVLKKKILCDQGKSIE